MKPRLWAALLIFLSGYSPLLLVLVFRDFDFDRRLFAHPYASETLLMIAIVSVLVTIRAVGSITGGLPILITSVRSRATDIVNYSLPYIAAFIGLDLGNLHDMGTLMILMIVLFVLAYRTNCMFVNPILACVGYQLFEITYEESGVSKSRDVLVKGELNPGTVYRAEVLARNLLLIPTETQNARTHHRAHTPTLAQDTEDTEADEHSRNALVSP